MASHDLSMPFEGLGLRLVDNEPSLFTAVALGSCSLGNQLLACQEDAQAMPNMDGMRRVGLVAHNSSVDRYDWEQCGALCPILKWSSPIAWFAASLALCQ